MASSRPTVESLTLRARTTACAHAWGTILLGLLLTVGALLAPATASAGDPWTVQGGVMNLNTATEVTETGMTVLGTTPHVAFLEGGDVFVKRWNGAAWVQDGAARLNTTAGVAKGIDIVNDGTNVYVAWHEPTGGFDNLYVKRWNGAAWAALGGSLNISAARSGIDVSLAVVNGTLTAAWKEDTAGTNDVYVKQWNGAAWNAVGGAVEPTPAQWVNGVAVTGNATNLYVAVGNWDGINYDTYVRRWNGAAWVTVGGGGLNVDANQWAYRTEAIMQGATLVVSWSEDVAGSCCRIVVKQWDGAAWTQLAGNGVNPDVDGWSWKHDLTPGPTGPLLVHRKVRNPYSAEVVGWTGTDWKRYGGVINQDKREAGLPSVGNVSGTPWVVFAEDDTGAVGQLRGLSWNPTTTMVGQISNFTASPTSGQIAFTWTNPPDGNYSGVDIYRSTTEAVRGTLVQSVAPPTSNWTDTGRPNGTRYYYTFITRNSVGDVRETSYETADANIVFPRYMGAFESDGTDAYAFGGMNETSTQQTAIFRYATSTTATSLRTAAMPTARSDMRSAWVGGSVNRIVLLGGDSFNAAAADIYRYDPGGDLLVDAGVDLPSPRSSGGVAYAPNTGRVYYLGGNSKRSLGGTVYDTILWYDPVANTTGTLGVTLPQPMWRMSASYWPGDGCIYMFGGKTTGDVDSNKIVKFCPATGIATNLTVTMPIAMSEITLSRASHGIVLLGASATAYQQGVYEFDPFERAFLQHPLRMPFQQVTTAIGVAHDDVIYTASSWPLSAKTTQVNLGLYVDATASTPPDTPTNVLPASSAIVATATPTLTASAFSDPNADTHLASHWQVRTYAGTYTSAAFDSGLDFTNKTSIVTTSLAEGRHCFRVRYRDQNRVWSAFSAETCFWVDAIAENPLAGTSLEQHRANGTTVIPSGGYTTDGVGTNVVIKFDVSDPDGSQTLTPWVEVRPGATPFSVACGTSVAGVTFSGTAVSPADPSATPTATVNVTGLVAGTNYRWRACARDATARSGPWTNKGASPDFRVVVDQLPTATPLTPAAGSTWTDTTPTFVATFTDPDGPDTGTIDVEVCTANPTPAQTCTGAGGTLASSGASGSGIVNGATGNWTSPVVGLATYWWRVRARDQYDLEGAWSAGRQLTIGTPSLTINVDSATVTVPGGLPGTDVTGTTVVTISTSSASGYALTATDTSDTNAASCSVGNCAGFWVPDWTGTGALPTTWTTGTSGPSGYMGITVLSVTGFTATKLAKWGTGTTATDFTNNKYAGLATTASTLHTTSGYNSGNDTVTTAYRANAAASTRSGSYSATITYAAVANP